MLEAAADRRDDEVFRYFQTSTVDHRGVPAAGETLQVTFGAARRELLPADRGDRRDGQSLFAEYVNTMNGLLRIDARRMRQGWPRAKDAEEEAIMRELDRIWRAMSDEQRETCERFAIMHGSRARP